MTIHVIVQEDVCMHDDIISLLKTMNLEYKLEADKYYNLGQMNVCSAFEIAAASMLRAIERIKRMD